MTKDFWLELFRIFIGNIWARTGSIIAIAGALALTGWADRVIFSWLGIDDKTSNLVGLIVMFSGIGLLVHARGWASKSHSHDVQLLREYRKLIKPSLIRFLSNHCFRHRFANAIIDPLETLSDEWTTAHYDFQDLQVQASFSDLKKEVLSFNNLLQGKLWMDDKNPKLLTPMKQIDLDHGISDITLRDIDAMGKAARAISAKLNDFEKLARRKIPEA